MKTITTTLLLVAATAVACDGLSDNMTPTGTVLSAPQAEAVEELGEAWATREFECCGFAFERTPYELDSLENYVGGWDLELDLECAAPPPGCDAPPLTGACQAPCKTGFGDDGLGSTCTVIDSGMFYADTCQQGLLCLGEALDLPSQCVDPCEARIGDPCNVYRRCGDGAVCLPDGDDPYQTMGVGSCVAAPAIGEACHPYAGCGLNGGFCSTAESGESTCVSTRELGEACSLWSQCKSGHCGPDGGFDWLETPAVCTTQEFPECANNVDGF